MVESRWLRWIGPGVVALGAVGLIASTTRGAGDRPWTPPPCGGAASERIVASMDEGPPNLADLRVTPWFRLDPVLDAEGALRGQQLAVGLDGDRAARILGLPAESFAAGPFGRVVLVGSDDGTTSRLQAIDVARGCTWAVALERVVIRRATVDSAGAAIYEARVDRASRADLGIWRRPMDGGGTARPVLGPLVADGRFGRTFSTEFSWDDSGDRLAVQSCGEVACRTRVIGPGDAPTATLESPDLGALVGFDGDVAVTYGACRGLPCPIVSSDLRTGDRRVLAEAAGLSILVATPDGPRVVHEVADRAGWRLRSVALDGGAATDLGPLAGGLRLHPAPISVEAATRVPFGWVLLAPDGRIPAPGSAASLRPQLRHIPDGVTVPLDEVAR
jgi:hypothetical protein